MSNTENIKVSHCVKLSHLTHFFVREMTHWVTHFSPRCVISRTKMNQMTQFYTLTHFDVFCEGPNKCISLHVHCICLCNAFWNWPNLKGWWSRFDLRAASLEPLEIGKKIFTTIAYHCFAFLLYVHKLWMSSSNEWIDSHVSYQWYFIKIMVHSSITKGHLKLPDELINFILELQ